MWFCLCVSLCIIGSVIMIAADAQKYFTLRVQRGLITDGMHRYVRHPNYLGEMMIYASFAMMVGHWLPWVWLAIIWASLFATNMVMKEASMRSEEHTSELQSLMRISYAVFCLKKKKKQ